MNNVATTFCSVQFAEHHSLDLFLRAMRPGDDVQIAAETDLVSVLPTQGDDIHPRFRFKRIVGIHPDVNEILKDPPDVSASVIDDRKSVRVAFLDNRFDNGLEASSPIVG